MNFLLAIMKSFLHLGGLQIAMILCVAAGIIYLARQSKNSDRGKNQPVEKQM
ncbi:hypothetical protein [Cytobacillus praedii]|uniref:hypothetical protein n=1 Tax=Cytobacillus praedii TaxID=1742358 RepID=UPI0012F7FF9A|nr:hypothetical protein [Cytobacillus praedii]